MPGSHSTPPRAQSNKPAKPSPDFPLFPHGNHQWAKKIRRRLHYFGPWADPAAALAQYEQQKEALHAGRAPQEPADVQGETIRKLMNSFREAKEDARAAGELAERPLTDHLATIDLLIAHFGKERLLTDISIANFVELRTKLVKLGGKW